MLEQSICWNEFILIGMFDIVQLISSQSPVIPERHEEAEGHKCREREGNVRYIDGPDRFLHEPFFPSVLHELQLI